jgi:hypothetical protein
MGLDRIGKTGGAAREPQERTQGETATLVLVSRNHRSSGNPDALSGHSQSEADRDSLGADRETPERDSEKIFLGNACNPCKAS